MKLTKKLTEKDLKNISTVNIIIRNSHKKGESVIFKHVLTPLQTTVRDECNSVWKIGNKISEVKNEKYYTTFSKALKRINAAVAFQKEPTTTNMYSVTYNLKN